MEAEANEECADRQDDPNNIEAPWPLAKKRSKTPRVGDLLVVWPRRVQGL